MSPFRQEPATVSLSARRAWIEIRAQALSVTGSESSLSARRAWIEMMTLKSLTAYQKVALRKESVDRNYIIKITEPPRGGVALRKESVDRNYRCRRPRYSRYVALRKESVDRNIFLHPLVLILQKSLSARRAWIEIILSR